LIMKDGVGHKYLSQEYSYWKHVGLGAAMYSNCPKADCEVTLGKLVVSNNTVKNLDTGVIKPLNKGVIFYVGQVPVFTFEAKQSGL
jgi:hypothetical protein